jgi:amino-acid N-acetyltransferase
MTSPSFVQVLRGSAPYIHAHHGRTFVVAFGGEAAARANFARLIYDIALLHSLGVKLVLVHGSRPQIEARLKAAKLKSRFQKGLRITDMATLACVKDAVGALRMEIEALLSTGLASTPMGGAHLAVATGNLVTAKPVGVRNGIDHLHTGEVRRIDAGAIKAHLERDSIVLLSPVGYSPTGEIFNLRFEEVALAAAEAIGADKLVYLHADKAQGPRQIKLDEAEQLMAGRKADALEELVRFGVQACQHGVKRVHLISHAQDGALLQELYSRDGVGTLIFADSYDITRPATIDDIGGILGLITPLEQEGVLVPRSREQLELEIGHYFVMLRDGLITACCALMPYAEEKVGELAAVAVHPDYQKQGRASALLAQVERRARSQKLKKLFALTTHAPHWFIEHGFRPAAIDALPVKRKSMYNYQRNSKVLIKNL